MHYPKTRTILFVSFGFILAACAGTPSTTPSPLRVQYTFATQPWLSDLEKCAGEMIILPELTSLGFQDLASADMAIRIGGDPVPGASSYLVGTEDIIIILNAKNPIPELTTLKVTGIFTGKIQDWQELGGSAAPVQAWVFPPGEDLQRLFVDTALSGLQVTSQAHLATTPGGMIAAISEDVNAVGILTTRWLNDQVKSVYKIGEYPILAFLLEDPREEMEDIITCFQSQDW